MPVVRVSVSAVQHPLAEGHWLDVLHSCAHVVLPVPSSTHVEPVSQQLVPHKG
jgi:hypothetical protein